VTFVVNDKPIHEATVPLAGRTGNAKEKGKFRIFLNASAKQKVELDYVKVCRLSGS
jgi:hypothetical protein